MITFISCEPAEERSQRRQHHRQDAPGARRGGPVRVHGDHEFRRVGEDDSTGGGAVSTARRLS